MSALAKKLEAFRSGWLASQVTAWNSKSFKTAPRLTAAEATPEFVNKCLASAYDAVFPLSTRAPQFVVTSFGQGEAQNGQLGLTAWACTWIGRPVTDVNKFIYKTCKSDATAATQAAMFRLIRRIDNDWIAAPLVALILRMAMGDLTHATIPSYINSNNNDNNNNNNNNACFVAPTKLDAASAQAVEANSHRDTFMGMAKIMAENGGGHLGLVEIETPAGLPVLQFEEKGDKKLCQMSCHKTMNALRVGSSVLEPIHGKTLRGRADNACPLDVEVTVFMLRKRYVDNKMSDDFDDAFSDLMTAIKSLIRELWQSSRAAPKPFLS